MSSSMRARCSFDSAPQEPRMHEGNPWCGRKTRDQLLIMAAAIDAKNRRHRCVYVHTDGLPYAYVGS